MPRSTNNVAAKNRRKKYLKAAKGYVGGRSKLYRTARQAVEKGWLYAYRDRKTKKISCLCRSYPYQKIIKKKKKLKTIRSCKCKRYSKNEENAGYLIKEGD